jgi:amidase
MNRRNFLKNTSKTSLSLTAMSLGLLNEPQNINNSKQYADFDLNEITINELQQKMQAGTATAVSLTNMYLKRIKEIDKKGPKINAVIELNPDAVAIATALDRERKAGKIRGPLHGIPVLIKDNINTGDKMMTTAGSLALVGNIATKDAFIVQQLRAAGAVLLGKTNLSEWANFRSSRSTSGWSSRGGQTRCPYILDRNPSGSSAGSGAAAAANFCTIAIGTETDGSIVSPASKNGLVGIKPTVGLWSRSGIIPISATQDTAGPMARTVSDAAILLGALTGIDNADAVTKESKGKSFTDYTTFLQKDGLKNKRIGIEKNHLQGHEGVAGLYKEAIEVMKKMGATIIEVELLKSIRVIGNAEFEVLLYEFKDGLNRYLATANSNIKSLADVITFNSEHEPTTMPFFKQETLINSNGKGDTNSKEYKEAIAKTFSTQKIIRDLMQSNNLDALCGVTGGMAGCIDLINGDYNTGFSFSSPAAVSGFPHITVPMGLVQELPVGISFISKAYAEPTLFSIAYSYEQASMKRVAPKFIGTMKF